MKNCFKVIMSLAIGAVVGVVTYFSTKSSSSNNKRVSNTCKRSESDPIVVQAREAMTNEVDELNDGGEYNSASPSRYSYNSNRVNKDGFLEFLSTSQNGLERLLRILKNIALSIEYMAKLFANSGIRGALPPARCC